MHAHRAAALAVTLVLIASGLALFATAPATAANVPLGPQPSATVAVSATNQYGTPMSNFEVGYASGVVYFSAYDPSDTQATITITDTNATRDNVSTPAFTYVASFSSSSYNESWAHGVGYLLPLNLTYGGNWTISISGSSGGVANATFYVHTYYTSVTTTHVAYLPGHAGTGLFHVARDANDAPYSWSKVKVLSQYYTSSGTWNTLPGSPYSFSNVAQGTFNFTVPLTASITGEIVFVIFANTTTGNSEFNTWAVSVGNMSVPILHIGSCPNGCYTNAFRAGSTVYISVQELINAVGYTAPAAGIRLTLSFASGSLPVTPPGVPANLSTNATGQAAFVFLASTSIFSTTQANEVTVTASDPQNPSLPTASSHAMFAVSNLTAVTPELTINFASLQYYGGDTATLNWQLGGLNSTSTAGWVVNNWQVVDNTGGALFAWGMINSTQTKGTVSFTIPTNYGGSLTAYATAYNVSDSIVGISSSSAVVSAPTILLNPSETYYLPGDTVTVSVTTEGSIFSSTTLYESVTESSGYTLSSGVLSGSQITVDIPTTGAPSSITVSVAAQSSSLGIVSSNSLTLGEGSGYVLYAGISTPSNYVDGSYQPGQTIKISYSLTAVGTATLPKTFEVNVYPGSAMYGGAYGALVAEVSSPSGTVSYTLPSNLPAGAQSFTVVVTSGICGYSCGAANQFSALVEPNPSPLSYELGAGSGVTVGWVVLLVLILLVFLAAVVWMRRAGGRSGGKSPGGVKPFEHPSSDSSSTAGGSSSGSSSSAWKEESGSTSSEPPMPGSPPH